MVEEGGRVRVQPYNDLIEVFLCRPDPLLQRGVREAECRRELQNLGGLLSRLQDVLRHVLLLLVLLHLHHPGQQQHRLESSHT